MKCFVTGANGLIGSNLAHALVARGYRVKALVRPGSDLRALAGVEVEFVEGDVSDRDALRSMMADCRWCFHLAASYRLWVRDSTAMYAINVEGTRNVIEAAAAAGCARIMYTSTVGCIAPARVSGGRTIPSDETASVPEPPPANPYKRSKWLAEQVAFEWARRGAPVVIVNPSAPIGPRDVKPTPTGRWIVDFLNRSMPAYVDTGLNWVHVQDVAAGHILAAELGAVGERYILANREGNRTLREAMAVLEAASGVPAPRVRLPYGIALLAGHLSEALSALTGRPPRVPLAGVRMARRKMYFDPSKAIRELGLPQTPWAQAFADAAAWFRANGYVRPRRVRPAQPRAV